MRAHWYFLNSHEARYTPNLHRFHGSVQGGGGGEGAGEGEEGGDGGGSGVVVF